MAGVRRAMIFASLGRYAVVTMRLVSTFIVARLMTPADFGISVVGTSALAIAEVIRQLGSIQYIVQERELTPLRIRTSFTICLIVTLAISALLLGLGPRIAVAYQMPGLAPYLIVQTCGFLAGPFAQPTFGLLSRAGRFGRIAIIDTVSAALNAATMIVLALVGLSYMSIAWAGLASSLLAMVLLLAAQRDTSVFLPSLREWRRVVAFDIYGSGTGLIYKFAEAGWYLVAGRVMDARAIGLLQRASVFATFPDRMILAGMATVALPSFSSLAHRGENVAASYLRWISYATAILWPALVLIGFFAPEIVSVSLGVQWQEAVPLVQILAGSTALMFPLTLNNAAQIATGGIRDLPMVALLQAAVALPVLLIAAHIGIEAVAWSTFITALAATGVSTVAARRHVGFAWSEFVGSIASSLVLALATAIGPLVLLMSGLTTSHLITLGVGSIAGGLGWLVAVYAVRHPIHTEVDLVLSMVLSRLARVVQSRAAR